MIENEGDNCLAIDVATGDVVTLLLAPAGTSADQQCWSWRCDELYRLRHPAIAVLVDYGVIGHRERFEAWRCKARWQGSRRLADWAATAASEFLSAFGMTAARPADSSVHQSDRGPVIVPTVESGYRPSDKVNVVSSANSVDSLPTWSGRVPVGVEVADRESVTALGQMIRVAAESRPRIAALIGPRGSGRTTAVMILARIARTSGLVPIDSRLLEWHHRAVPGRSLFIIDRSEGTSAWAAWLQATMRTPGPHVSLLVGSHEVRGVEGVVLEQLPSAELLSSVHPAAAREMPSIRRAAAGARGLPGRFVSSLWPPIGRTRRSSMLSRVAESVAVYGNATDPRADPWPLPDELAELRRKVERATSLIEEGRHAPGLRRLRQAASALARRGSWADAAQGWLQLASALLGRGRARDAREVLTGASDYAVRGGAENTILDLATLTGESSVDMAHLDEAERILSATLASARAAGVPVRVLRAALGLARCLFWRGRHREADGLLRERTGGDHPSWEEIRRLRHLARNVVALRDPSTAMSALADARARAVAAGNKRFLADVEYTAAFVHLMLGDLDAVDRDASAFAAAAASLGRLRCPPRTFSVRLIQEEANRRRGQTAAATTLTALRRSASVMAPMLKARWELFAALTPDADTNEATVQRLASAWALPSLTLLAQPVATTPDSGSIAGRFVDEMVAILHVCQKAADDVAILKEVCARVRRHLGATGVLFVTPAARRLDVVAFDGSRGELHAAERAMAAGITIAPYQRNGVIESAAAVQYGGRVIGALTARWTLGSTHDLSHAGALLSTAATAAAPMLAAAMCTSARDEAAARPGSDLLGVTPVMAELRRAVERAASPPFPVLIEGESGAGKELVARAIHRLGPRRQGCFFTLNCAALPEELVEAELFGHARGSFTGALADRAGVFEQAHGGTLFLDEIGELSPRAQAKLLRVIQEGEIRRVGENVPRRVDTRIVSATNRDLAREVGAGRFRADLLYRLDVIRISVPALRDRRDDVLMLIDHFWVDITRRLGSRAILASATRTALASYDWPGNVRELQNVLASLAVRSPKRGVVTPTALPAHLVGRSRQDAGRLDSARRTFEESFVRAALVRSGGHRGRAAEGLGLTRQGLTKLMNRLGIDDSTRPRRGCERPPVN